MEDSRNRTAREKGIKERMKQTRTRECVASTAWQRKHASKRPRAIRDDLPARPAFAVQLFARLCLPAHNGTQK